MRAWGGEHEARYKDEMKLLKMVTAKEHAEASAFCQLVSFPRFSALPFVLPVSNDLFVGCLVAALSGDEHPVVTE